MQHEQLVRPQEFTYFHENLFDNPLLLADQDGLHLHGGEDANALVPLHLVALLHLQLNKISTYRGAHVLRVMEDSLLPHGVHVFHTLVLDLDRSALAIHKEVQLTLTRHVERVGHHNARDVQSFAILNVNTHFLSFGGAHEKGFGV